MSHPRFAIREGGRGFQNEVVGACAQPEQTVDRFVASELTNRLFANKNMLGEAGGRKL